MMLQMTHVLHQLGADLVDSDHITYAKYGAVPRRVERPEMSVHGFKNRYIDIDEHLIDDVFGREEWDEGRDKGCLSRRYIDIGGLGLAKAQQRIAHVDCVRARETGVTDRNDAIQDIGAPFRQVIEQQRTAVLIVRDPGGDQGPLFSLDEIRFQH